MANVKKSASGQGWWRSLIMREDSLIDKAEEQPLSRTKEYDVSSYSAIKDPDDEKPIKSEEGTMRLTEHSSLNESVGGGSSDSLNHSIVGFLEDFMFPPDTPPQLQLFRSENIAIPVCYLMVGMTQGLFRTLLNVYPIDVGATEAQQTTFATIAILPAAFKILYGFTTDNLPIFGYRRKPYLFSGWFFSAASMWSLWGGSDLTLPHDENGRPLVPERAPSMFFLMISFFAFGVGMWFADATADAVVAEKARLEPPEAKGTLQSTCYTLRFFGMMVSAPVSTVLYVNVGPRVIVQLLCFLPCLMFPLSILLEEEHNLLIRAIKDQCLEIWNTVCSRSVWEPMSFVYLFNLMQVTNAAWRQYLTSVQGFTASELNALLVASYVLLYIGTMVYKYFLLKASWRLVYKTCIIMAGLFSSLQICLIRGYTFGISSFFFALGDDAFFEFLSGVQFLPLSLMMVALCPPGSEGASYAIFTTVWNSALMIAPAISSLLLGIWDVSKEALESGQLDGLVNLTLLCTVIRLFPITFLCWLPHGQKELEELARKPLSGSKIGGGIFLAVLFASMCWTFLVAVLNIVHPGWAGGS